MWSVRKRGNCFWLFPKLPYTSSTDKVKRTIRKLEGRREAYKYNYEKLTTNYTAIGYQMKADVKVEFFVSENCLSHFVKEKLYNFL